MSFTGVDSLKPNLPTTDPTSPLIDGTSKDANARTEGKF